MKLAQDSPMEGEHWKTPAPYCHSGTYLTSLEQKVAHRMETSLRETEYSIVVTVD
jgi:hypothetical protein